MKRGCSKCISVSLLDVMISRRDFLCIRVSPNYLGSCHRRRINQVSPHIAALRSVSLELSMWDLGQNIAVTRRVYPLAIPDTKYLNVCSVYHANCPKA